MFVPHSSSVPAPPLSPPPPPPPLQNLNHRPTFIPIKGDVTGIERAPGRTEVLVDEGLTHAAYALDEGLIDFGAALEFLVGLVWPARTRAVQF